MRHLILPLLVLATTTTAMAQYHNDITPINDVNNTARNIVKGFKVQNLKIVAGAPEYAYVYKAFLNGLKGKEDLLAQDLKIISDRLSKDYSILKAIEKKEKTAAVKATIKQAEERLKDKVKAERSPYHAALRTFITPPENLFQKCLSALCVNQVMEDYRAWIQEASKVNKTIKIYSYKLKKMKYRKNRNLKDYKESALYVSNNLPIAIELTDERMPFISKYGIDLFFKYNFEAIKKYGIDMLEKHSLEALQRYELADLEKFGYENLRNYRKEYLEKYGVEAVQKFSIYDLEKFGAPLLLKYGVSDMINYGAELLNKYGAEALKKFGVQLLSEGPVEELVRLEKEFGLNDVKKFGFSLNKYSLESLNTFGSRKLNKYGEAKIQKYSAKYGIVNVQNYELDSLDKFSVEKLEYYGEEALLSYGLANCEKWGISALELWGAENLNKYGFDNLIQISNPKAVVGDRALPLGWNNDDSSGQKKYDITCTAALGESAVAIQLGKWAVPENYPIGGGSNYVIPHTSGQTVLTQCPVNQNCRTWKTIFCAKK